MQHESPRCGILGWTRRLSAGVLLAAVTAQALPAAETSVAVAANFTGAAKELGVLFSNSTTHEAIFSFGSTGQLYAQISQDAPFDVFLAADSVRPKKAVGEGLAVDGSRFTYATGRIALFSRDSALITDGATLKHAEFATIAIPNPVTAPYGAAAVEVLMALNVYDVLSTRIVQGTNVAQTYQFIATGNAELGFVALSQIAGHRTGSRWIVPEALHSPIKQDAVLLIRGAANPAALAFVSFLRSPEARTIIREYGYGVGG